jgi:methylmalonyl-CoA/ethylmalonyl-CoA epimerase
MKFHHLGIACRDISQAAQTLQAQGMGRPEGERVWDAGQEAWLQMIIGDDGSRIELVQGPKVESLAKGGTAFYHICYEVEDLDASVEAQIQAGATLVEKAVPAPLFNGRRVAFVKGDAGLIELLEA